MPITFRRPTPDDVPACGRIVFEAFGSIAGAHSFPHDFPSPEAATEMAAMMVGHPKFFGVVAVDDDGAGRGRVVGLNFLDTRDAVAAVGPICVDPAWQGRGAGRKLMAAVVDAGRDAAAGIRLVQDAFNTASMSLYASLGFEAREPLALVRGTPKGHVSPGAVVRPMGERDLAACAELCRRAHGLDRTNELREAIVSHRPAVLTRDGRVTAYASAPGFWLLNHGVAESERDMTDLLTGAATTTAQPVSFLLPIRQAALFRWALSAGLRVVKPMTLMTMGRYQEPAGCWYPSVQY